MGPEDAYDVFKRGVSYESSWTSIVSQISVFWVINR